MCVVSMIGDSWGQRHPWQPHTWPQPVDQSDQQDISKIFTGLGKPTPTADDITAIWKELNELKELLVKAKQYDSAHGEPDCEMEDKITLIKKFGEVFSIDFRGIFDNEKELSVPNDNEFFRVMSPIDGELARFADEEMAAKFADYIKRYRNEENIFVIEVHPVDLTVLKYVVYLNDKLVSAFVDFDEAKEYALTIADASAIFNPDEPKPEVRIALI